MINRMNRDLANDYGNLAQRVLSMIAKNCGGQVPEHGDFSDDDRALLKAADELLSRVREAMAAQALSRSLEAVFELVAEANRYVDAQAPWALRKTDPVRMATVLYTLAETIRRLALLTQAFMPEASAKLLDQLAVPAEARLLASYGIEAGGLRPGASLPKPEGVFPRHVEDAAA